LAVHSLYCLDMPLRNYSLTYFSFHLNWQLS